MLEYVKMKGPGMSIKSFSLPLLITFIISSGCGGNGATSASTGFGTSSSTEEPARFGVGAVQNAQKQAELASIIKNEQETSQGVIITFTNTVDTGPKAPTVPTKETTWIKGRVVSVAPDFSYFTMEPDNTTYRPARIGEEALVLTEWPVESDIATSDTMRESSIATGRVESASGGKYLVKINMAHSGAKIPDGSPVVIGWY